VFDDLYIVDLVFLYLVFVGLGLMIVVFFSLSANFDLSISR